VDLTHAFSCPASIDDVWATFNDLEGIAPCFPGASITSYDGESFEGLVKVKLGPISLQYAGSGRFVERDEPAHRAVIEAKGKDKHGNGTAMATITASLASAGDARTDVTVTTDLSITGKPAQFGRGVMQDVSDKLLRQFVSCLETKLGESATAVPDGTAEDLGTTGATTSPFGDNLGEPGATSSTDESKAAPADAAKHRAAAPIDSEPVAALDVGAAVLPVLLRRYGRHLVGAIVGLWILRKIFRRRSRRASA
jgi:carbon monoxide dehydrogenase subunit G